MNIIVKIESYDHQARGISHYNNKVMFIPNALLNEELEVKIIETYSVQIRKLRAVLPLVKTVKDALHISLKEAKDMGYSFNVGPECEFFLLETDEKGRPKLETQDKSGYFDMSPLEVAENARRDMTLVLEEMGFEVEASHHEVAYGQNEIDFKHDTGLISADNFITTKIAIKTIASFLVL